MAIFLTGATGYIGSYVAAGLLDQYPSERLALLVRAKSPAEAEERLWKSMQLHLGFDEFIELIRTRCDLYLGDLTFPELGLSPDARDKLVKSMDSVLHVAASLNRKSSKACFNVNLRGTLSVLKLARDAHDHHGLRRFTDISTVAVAGERKDEVVGEDNTIDWDKSDYDPYARTKKFCEHMLHELLPDVHGVVLRPSIVLGDSRFPETTQFDMVRAFAMLAQLPVLPFNPDWRLDIVPADYVSKAIVQIHQADKPRWSAYNLSSGTSSLTYRQVTDALREQGHPTRHRFAPVAQRRVHPHRRRPRRDPARLGRQPARVAAQGVPPVPHLQHRVRQHPRRHRARRGPAPVRRVRPRPAALRARRQVHLPLQALARRRPDPAGRLTCPSKPETAVKKAPPKKRGLWDRITDTFDPDRALQATMRGFIEATAVKHVLGVHDEQWAPGKPLKLLLAGYVGTRNTGADVRVEEMIRQFRHVVGDDQLEMAIMTSDEQLTRRLLPDRPAEAAPAGVPQVPLRQLPQYHGVVACEGSMFKSKFASALTCMMAGAMGMAVAERKLSVGYGAEAGAMTPSLKQFVADVCKGSLVICRNEPSRAVLGPMGIRTTSGADTAWTFEPAPLPRGEQLLRDAGWDGRRRSSSSARSTRSGGRSSPTCSRPPPTRSAASTSTSTTSRSTSTTTATRPTASTTRTCRPSPTRSTTSAASATSSRSSSAWSSSTATPARI
jgi:thioester reductase-like protein